MSITNTITTAQQLFQAGDIGRAELVRGEVVMMSPAGNQHGRVTFNLALLLGNHVKSHQLGIMYTAETGFLIERDPDTVLAPDIAFICADRAPDAQLPGYVPVAPDLAVEVISPHDRASEVAAKVQLWLHAGCRLVWVVDPQNQSVSAYESGGQVQLLDSQASLSGQDVIPGFAVAVSDVFDA